MVYAFHESTFLQLGVYINDVSGLALHQVDDRCYESDLFYSKYYDSARSSEELENRVHPHASPGAQREDVSIPVEVGTGT